MPAIPDSLRATLGRVLLWLLRWYKVSIPSADVIFNTDVAGIAKQVQAAMDAVDANGKRGGWAAGKAVIDAARKPGAQLFSTPEWLLVTLFMGLSGSLAPRTAADAKQKIAALKQQYTLTGRPDYLFGAVMAEALKQLEAADKTGNRWTAGILKKMFEIRDDSSIAIGRHAREQAVLMVFKQHPEFAKFLTVGADGSLSLPRGKSYEEFAASMLANAYGPYPF